MEFELTPEALDAWNRSMAEILRRSETMEAGMREHYRRPVPGGEVVDTGTDPTGP